MSGTDSIIILLVLRQWGVLKEGYTSLLMRMIGGISQRNVHTRMATNKSSGLFQFPSFSYVLMFICNPY